jgi:glutathione S-transferase
MLTIHHLGTSQSERIVWLCEELAIPYELKRYERDPVTRAAPATLKELHPLGNAPVISDSGLVLAESGAVVEYIIAKHGGGRLALGPAHPDFPHYLYWFHFSNGNLQPQLLRNMVLDRLALPATNPTLMGAKARMNRTFDFVNERLRDAPYLAGAQFTAADIMTIFSLTTMRLFFPFDIQPYANIKAYLQRIGARDAYQIAMKKGDPDLVPMLT